MQWTCAKCGRTALAVDWTLLVTKGWRTTPDNEFRCATCAKQEPARAEGDLSSAVRATPARRREMR